MSNFRCKFMGCISARIAQLVEHDLAKVGVAGSSPVSRSLKAFSQGGEIGIHARLKILWLRPCGFEPRSWYVWRKLAE